MGRRPGRGRLAAALAVAAVSLVAVPASGAACAVHERLQDLWTRIPSPFSGSIGATMTAYDVADPLPGHIVTTNGVSISTTSDDGCHWRNAALPAETVKETDLGDATVVGRSVSQVRYSAHSARHVWALGQTDVAAVNLATTQPRVLLSDDGGASFATRTNGLPQFGRPVAIRALGPFAALLFRATVPSEDYRLYVTADAGGTWTLLWSSLPALSDLVLDGRTDTIWLWSSGGLYRGGVRDEEPEEVDDVNGAIKAVDVTGDVVSVFLVSGAERFTSTDGGRTFATRPAPDRVQSATGHVAFPGMLAISSVETNVLVEPPTALRKAPVDYSPREANVSDLQFVQTVSGDGFPLYAFNAMALYRRMVPLDFAVPPPPPPEPPVDVRLYDRPKIRQVSEIAPVAPVVRLRPGQSRTVPFRMDLAPVPTPLDVFFMTDSTKSMRNAIASVQDGVRDIVDELEWLGINVHFGVADFRDYPERGGGDGSNYPYKRRRAVGPINTALYEALESISTGGGTVDGHDAGLEAIYQAVTGAGRLDPLGVEGELIPAGLGAEFRPEAMKVVLIATDDNFRHPRPGYPGPSVDAVSRVLVEHGVYLVGIHVDTNSGSARVDMERLAEDTGAVAPRGGVDCDADRRPDIRASDPIVCDFDASAGDSMVGAFVSMLAGIRDEAAVDLAVTGPPALAAPAGPTSFPKVNVKAENSFTLPVRFTCPAGSGGTTEPVRIAARSRGAEVVGTTATVQCVAPEQPKPPPAPPPLIPPAALVALAPPPPPPPAQLPNPPPQLNPNVNPQANPNPGLAAEQEQEFQLALADNEAAREDLAMSGLARSAPPVPAVAWAAACAMTAAAAFGLHLQRRARPAPAFNPWEH